MGRAYDPARAMRERLKLLEQRERERTEAHAVAEGVAETVALSRARGAAIDGPEAGAAKAMPYHRRLGLEWLAAKGKITATQKAAGERYGDAWRRAGAAAALGSTLDIQPGSSAAGGPSLSLLLKMAEGRRQAAGRLVAYRQALFGQGDLVTACDRICGQEMIPREAAGGDRDAARMEAVLKVALDILAAAAR